MFDAAAMMDPNDEHALAKLPAERLEAELMGLAGHLAAATCSFLLLVAEFDRRDGAADWECLSTAHWLNWKCGVGMSAAREQVRVARRLGELPVVRTEFAAGRLSYSKVRAITRVASPDIEDGLVRVAQHSTAAQLDRMCAALRRTRDLDDAERELRDQEESARACESLSWRRRDDGSIEVRARLSAEHAETFLAAIGAATAEPEPGQPPGEHLDRRRAHALVDIAAAHLAHPEPGRSPRPEIIVHVDATAAVTATAAAQHPDPDDIGDIGDTDGADGADDPVGPRRWPVATNSGTPLSLAALERLCCDAGRRYVATLPDGSELNLGRHQHPVSAAQRRALQARDRHCRFPGCDRRSRLHAHHILWWSRGGRTDMDNLLLLCPKHHRAVHEGGWTLTGTADDHTFTRPDHTAVSNRPPRVSGATAELVRRHRLHGRDIILHGAGGRWEGDHVDWDCFFAAFAN